MSSSTHVYLILSSVNSIAQTTAWQLQRTDIRVNALCPGLIETGMSAAVFDYARQRGTIDKIGQLNPMGRYGVAEGSSSFLYSFEIWPLMGSMTWTQRLQMPRCF